ncbi:hypothetical protein D3C81_2222490 [compost metagenome]
MQLLVLCHDCKSRLLLDGNHGIPGYEHFVSRAEKRDVARAVPRCMHPGPSLRSGYTAILRKRMYSSPQIEAPVRIQR